jgi:UDP-GlcNAc:undecaprenyl-phosphate GlcNAc-1-phosphate transferase
MIPPILAAFAGTVALMLPVMALAHRLGAVAQPRGDRWGERSVPRIGGVAIALALVIAAAFLPLAAGVRGTLALGVCVVAVLGLVDDLGSVSPARRLAVETLVGAGAVGIWWSDLGWIAWIAAGAAAIAVPLLVNATNLVDNADGVAASLSAFTGLGLAAIALLAGSDGLAAAGLSVASICLAFLAFNLPPARVYMGDVGSLSLGFFLAAVTALLAREAVASEPARLELLVALPLLWAVQLGDLGMVLVTRLRRGASPLRGGVDHTTHRLMRAGLSPRTMLVAVAAVAALGAALAVIGSASGSAITAAILVVLAILMVAAAEGTLATRVAHE